MKILTPFYLGQFFILAIFASLALVPCAYAETVNGTGPGYITVTSPPTADFYTSTRYGAAPFTTSFSDNSVGEGPFAYLWDFGDNTTSDRQHPYHTYRANGLYTVCLTVTSRLGSDTKTMPAYIGVGEPLNATFFLSGSQGIAPLTVTFYGMTQSLPATWSWDFGDGATSSGQTVIHTYTSPGSYNVTVEVANAFESAPVAANRIIVVGSPAETPVVTPAIPAVKKPEGLTGLILAAKGTTAKNLPTSGIIPPQFMALAAVVTSLAVVLAQLLITNIGMLSQIALKFLKFFADLAGVHAVEKLSEKEIEIRRITVRRLEPQFLGLSSTEILIIEAAVFMVALAFILADRAALTLTTVLIYIAVGAVSVVLHDFAHRTVVTRHGYDADTRFWGLGTIIMFLTAWLYGNAFAQPYRNLSNREGEPEARELGMEMIAGPCVSIVLTFVFLSMVTLGGIWAVAGGIGFSVNLITAVYSLMPIDTMDGLAIWRWNRWIYLILFLPIFAFYLFTYIVVA